MTTDGLDFETYGDDGIKLSGDISWSNESASYPLFAILSTDATLKIDLNSKGITVDAVATTGITAGIAYVGSQSDTPPFTGSILNGGDITITAKNNAYGLAFAGADTSDPLNGTVYAALSNSTINVGAVSVTTEGMDAIGFISGDLTGSTSVTLGDITAEAASVASQKSRAYGFVAGDVGADSSVNLENITAKITGTAGTEHTAIGVELGNVSGEVKVDGKIEVATSASGNGDHAFGFSAKSILSGAEVELGEVDVKFSGTTGQNASVRGVTIGRLGGDSSGNVAGTLSVGDITVEGTDVAEGFNIYDGGTGIANVPAITGEVTLNKIEVKATGTNGRAFGISLGEEFNPTNFSSYAKNLGSADVDKLKLEGDISVESEGTGSNAAAIGIFAGQLEELNVGQKISATVSGTNATNYAVGIWTAGFTNVSDKNDLDKASKINIKDGAVFETTGGTDATNQSIRMDSVETDIVDIQAGSSSTAWTNDSKVFTLSGVEKLNVTGFADLSATDSTRGRASEADTDISTDISGSLKVKDSFFDASASGDGKSIVNVTGKLEITAKNDTPFDENGFVDKLTIDGSNASVTLKANAELQFKDEDAADTIAIKNSGTLTIETGTGGLYNEANKTQYQNVSSGNPAGSNPLLGLTVDGGTLKVVKEGSVDKLSARGIKTTIGQNGATADIGANASLEVGKVIAESGVAADLTKKGEGKLSLAEGLDLNEGTLTIEKGTVQFDRYVQTSDTQDTKANVAIQSGARLEITDRETWAIKKLTGGGEIAGFVDGSGHSTLKVESGDFSGNFINYGNVTKTGNGSLTLSGNNTSAGTFKQEDGMVTLKTAAVNGAKAWNGDYNLTNGTLVIDADGNGTKSVEIAGDTTVGATGKIELKDKLETKKFSVANGGEVALDYDIPTDSGTFEAIKTQSAFDNTTQDALRNAIDEVHGLLYGVEANFANNGVFGINFTIESAEAIAVKQEFKGNLVQVAELLDENRAIAQSLGFFGLQSGQEEIFESMLRGQAAGELAGDILTVVAWDPQLKAYDHLSKLGSFALGNSTILGQSCCGTGNGAGGLWFEGYYSGGKVNDDSNALGYDHERGGILVGFDSKINRNLLAGFLFGYGNPHASNQLGRIEGNDFTFAGYSQYKLNRNVLLNGFLGYGSQKYEYRQAAANAKFDGDALYASFELQRKLQLYSDLLLFPLVAIDFQKTWVDGFNIGQVQVHKSSHDQTVLRIGANSKYIVTDRYNLRTRLQYGVQIAGDLYGSSTMSFVGGQGTRTLKGVNLGRNRFNVGIGSDIYSINKQTKLFVDYDFDLGERSTAHTGQIGFAIKY